MSLAIVIVISATLALAVILSVAVTRSLQVKGSVRTALAIRPIDIEAFRNLTDPAEDGYLRRRLPPAQFRVVRRERLRAMAAYVPVSYTHLECVVRGSRVAFMSPRL